MQVSVRWETVFERLVLDMGLPLLGLIYCSQVCDCRINKAVDPKHTESGTGTLTVCTSSVHFLSVTLELNGAFIHAECVQ